MTFMKSLLSDACERKIDLGLGREYRYFSLPTLEAAGYGPISRLPVSLRIILESMARHCDGERVTERQLRDQEAAAFKRNAARIETLRNSRKSSPKP